MTTRLEQIVKELKTADEGTDFRSLVIEALEIIMKSKAIPEQVIQE